MGSLHHIQSYRNAAGFSTPWLSPCSIVPATGFDPETRDPEFEWLSRHTCAEPDAESPKPREWNSDPGTRSGFAPIGGSRHQSRNARRGLEDVLPRGPGYILLWGGAAEEPEFLLAEEMHEGGPVRGRRPLAGRRDEALEEADWEMSAGGGSRERDCAGRAVAAEQGYGVGFSGGLAGWQVAAWGRRSRPWPSARRGCCGSSSAGKLLSARRGGYRPVTGRYPGALRQRG